MAYSSSGKIFGFVLIFLLICMLVSCGTSMAPKKSEPTVRVSVTAPPDASPLEQVLTWSADRHTTRSITIRKINTGATNPANGIVVVDWDYNKSGAMKYAIEDLLEFVLKVSRDMRAYDSCQKLTFTVWCPAVDKYGNKTDVVGVTFEIKASTMDAINYDYMLKLTGIDQEYVINAFDHCYMMGFIEEDITSR